MSTSVTTGGHGILRDRNFQLMWLGTLGFWLVVFAHVPLLPLYLDEIGYSAGTIGLVYGSAALLALVTRIACGWAVDLYGERWFLLAGAALWIVTTPVPPFTTSLVIIELSWLVKGIGLGMFTTAAGGWVGRYARAAERGVAMGWWGTAMFTAWIVAPAGVVLVRDVSGYVGAFTAAAIVALLAGLAGFVPSTVHGGRAATPAGPRWQSLIAPRAIEPGLFGLVVGVASAGFTVFVPLTVEHAGLGQPGIYLSVYAGAGIIARLLAGPISDRHGRGGVILAGFVVCAAGMAVLGTADTHLQAGVAAVLFGAGMGATSPALLAWNADRSAAAQRGVATSTYFSLHEIGLFGGAWLVGVALGIAGIWAFHAVAVLLLVAVPWFVVQRWRSGEPVVWALPEGGQQAEEQVEEVRR
ncbi:MFS transporter [Haloechinothrix sp. LS1_15]|uniref:MFS transporter n=1 Tax=Haloechinothrix sp. LS1_15 TaxID=2652248 RepID=UPI00294B90E1|nr:MFS transporter [Haloechinothrix sp. LS1_15]